MIFCVIISVILCALRISWAGNNHGGTEFTEEHRVISVNLRVLRVSVVKLTTQSQSARRNIGVTDSTFRLFFCAINHQNKVNSRHARNVI